MIGVGPTTALALHLGAVLTHARWPTIACHELYEHDLLKERIPVVGGQARVPEKPGLGVDIDEEAVQRYRVEKVDFSLPKRLIKVLRPGGGNIHFADDRQKWNFYASGNQPVDEWDCRTEWIDDDGSREFDQLHKTASESPVMSAD
jgi:hypothetical protein